MDDITIGDEVHFTLDVQFGGKWKGQGTLVEQLSGDSFMVKLTKDCKEFKAEEVILVDGSEMYL